jgi:hypothetical protein
MLEANCMVFDIMTFFRSSSYCFKINFDLGKKATMAFRNGRSFHLPEEHRRISKIGQNRTFLFWLDKESGILDIVKIW